MSTVGRKERKTQERVVKLFRDTLKYDYLGDWTDRESNLNIEAEYLRLFLQKQEYSETLNKRAMCRTQDAPQ